jgi:hypothetical protein
MRRLRGLYVYKRLPMEAACAAMKLPAGTGKRWKAEARLHGDDWDKARSAVALGDETFGQLSRKLLEDYLVQHQAAMEHLQRDEKMTAAQRAEALSRLSDAFNKTMASFKRLSPDLNRHAIALDALQRLATFAQQRFPRHVAALLELLEPFGEELAKAYG